MDTERMNDNEQSALWNGTAGRAWVETQDLLDHMFKPIEDMLAQAVSTKHAQRVLDVGCGTGSKTLAASRRLGTQGHCVGIDISAQMIAMARSRAKHEDLPTTFICDDPRRHAFEPETFDLIISRFGVMFFDDFVDAFKILKQAARNNGGLHFYAWRNAEENPFMTTAERAAKALLLDMPTRRPDEPGQFAFARQSRVSSILQESGWSAINIEPVDITCTFPEADLVRYVTWMGPLGRVLQKLGAQDRQNVVETVRAAFDPYVDGDEVRFIAACWKVNATAL
jgi:ubiquinone/menaquinone biosynthesis C-methylase UbiE